MRTLDVSELVSVRKRLGRGALATRVAAVPAGLALAAAVFGFFNGLRGPANPFVIVAIMIGAIWIGFKLAEGLRSGSRKSATVLLWILVPYTGLFAISSVRGDNLFNLIFVLPSYFIFQACRKVLSLTTPEQGAVSRTSLVAPGRHNAPKRPAFGRRLSLWMYGLLGLFAMVWLGAISSVAQRGDIATSLLRLVLGIPLSDRYDAGYVIGYLGGTVVLPLIGGTAIYRRARRHAMVRAKDIRQQHKEAIILYLRSFGDDQLKMRAHPADGRWWFESALRVSFEEVVVDHMWRFGPVVAIGRPGEKLPPLGAARDQVAQEAWQSKVQQLMEQAAMVVLVVGRTEGVTWELSTLLRMGALHKLILLLPPTSESELRVRWSSLVERAASQGQLVLPRDLDLARTRAVVLAGDQPCVLAASTRDAWSYETVLDSAAQIVSGEIPNPSVLAARLRGPAVSVG